MRPWLLAGAINGFLAIAAGAFAAHGLSGRISPTALSWFETGVRYHAYHALALLAIAALSRDLPAKGLWWLGLAAKLFLAGILLFSGSLYAMALSGDRAFALITPIGGLCFLAGWACLVVLGLRKA